MVGTSSLRDSPLFVLACETRLVYMHASSSYEDMVELYMENLFICGCMLAATHAHTYVHMWCVLIFSLRENVDTYN
jgi:hypothetical protein